LLTTTEFAAPEVDVSYQSNRFEFLAIKLSEISFSSIVLFKISEVVTELSMIFTDATELLANSLFHIAFAAISAAAIVPFCISLPSMVLSCILSQESQCRNTFVPQTVIRADESSPGTSNLLSLHPDG